MLGIFLKTFPRSTPNNILKPEIMLKVKGRRMDHLKIDEIEI